MSQADPDDFRLGLIHDEDGICHLRLASSSQSVDLPFSHLHDSARDLILMALAVQAGEPKASAVFVVDPQELHWIVRLDGDTATCEVLQFESWASLEPEQTPRYRVLLRLTANIEAVLLQLQAVIEQLAEQKDLADGAFEFPRQAHRIFLERSEAAAGMQGNLAVRVARAYLVATVVPPFYLVSEWLFTILFALYSLIWVPNLIAMLIAAEAGWITWRQSAAMQTLSGKSLRVSVCAIIAGGTGFLAGFIWALLNWPYSLLAPLYAAFGIGAAGLITGALGALLIPGKRSRL